MTRLLAATLGLSVLGLTLWFGGAVGLVYLGLYGLALSPGLPVGWRLFGRSHPAGWVAGALIGYGLTALAFWVPVQLGVAGRVAFAVVWLWLAAAAWFVGRRGQPPLIELPEYQGRDLATWLLLLHLVPVFLALPFAHVGQGGRSGTRYYRAYFTADFVWHMALTEEIARFDVPVRNPYLASEPIHYYWAYFVVPAVLAGPEDTRLIEIESALKINATGTALLLLSMIFFTAWSVCGRSRPAAVACAVGLVAPSLEGTYAVIDLMSRGASLDALRDLNIDAVTAWKFVGLRVDGLLRTMWYTPQHATSLALGLVGVLAATRPISRHWVVQLLTGTALGLSVVMNPFLGAAFCVAYGVAVLVDLAGARLPLSALPALLVVVLPVLAGLGWCVANRMSDGAGAAVTIGWFFDARHAPVTTFLLSFGGLFAVAVAGFWLWRAQPWRPVVPAMAALVLGVWLLYFVSLTDRSWVGFRAGNILLTTMPMLAARGLAGLTAAGFTWIAGVGVALVMLAGAPTSLIDTYNAQDTSNRRISAGGFPWTIVISPAQQSGFRWIRQSTPPDAIVQMDPTVRDRQNWSAIPSFAGRRMAAGLPISLLPDPDYARRSQLVHDLMTRVPTPEAHAEAKRQQISHFWVDEDDPPPTRTAVNDRFSARPDLFTAVFRQGTVVIYRVN